MRMDYSRYMDRHVFLELAYFIQERERIRKKKEAGEPAPWTDDPILQKYKFCNIWRQDDKTTKFIHKVLSGTLWRSAILFIVWARLINRQDTLELSLPPVHGRMDEWEELLMRTQGNLTFSDAYIVLPNLPKGTKKLPMIIDILKKIDGRITASGLTERPTAYLIQQQFLQDIPRIKGLILYEIMCDLWQFLGEPESYVNIGGGARPSLERLFPGLPPKEEQIKFLTEVLNATMSHPEHGPLTWRCVEGALCEQRKLFNLRNNPKAKKRFYKYASLH